MAAFYIFGDARALQSGGAPKPKLRPLVFSYTELTTLYEQEKMSPR